MIILAIDTSTERGSVALLADGELLMEEHFMAGRSHSASLFISLEKARACVEGIDQVVIGLGPGSYAGVRIAISAALGFQLGLGAALTGIPSVAALETETPEYLAIGDARREAFYFTYVRNGVCEEGPLLLSETELRARLESPLPVYSCEQLTAFPNARVALPNAVRLARLAAIGSGIVQRDDLEPIYLREPHITLPKARPI
ncbi:MAG: tsaB [Chthoniobacteraceae bacterium]|nr:tsaB [Chthoniobacteraceae bacterium]